MKVPTILLGAAIAPLLLLFALRITILVAGAGWIEFTVEDVVVVTSTVWFFAMMVALSNLITETEFGWTTISLPSKFKSTLENNNENS